MAELHVRIPEALRKRLGEACDEQGVTRSIYARQAVAEKLDRQTGAEGLAEIEQRLRSALGEIQAALRELYTQQQSLYTIECLFVQAFLTCVPEPDNIEDARIAGRARWDKFLASVTNGAKKNGKGKTA